MFKWLFSAYQILILKIIMPLLTCFVYCPIIILFLLLKQYKIAGYVVSKWGRDTLWLLNKKYTIEGLENLDPQKRYLIISNHGSMVDIALNALLCTSPLSWVMKQELLRVPVANWMFMLGVGIPIYRSNARKSQQEILQKVQKLKNTLNPNIVIYPEGTRTKTGELNPFKRGFIQVMRAYNMDILPITLSGVVNFYSAKQKFPNSDSPIKITIHPVLPYETIKDMDDKILTQQIQDIIASVYYP